MLEEQIRSLQQLQRVATMHFQDKYMDFSGSPEIEMTKVTQEDSWIGASVVLSSQAEADEMEQHMNRNAQVTVQEQLSVVYQPLQN